MEYVIGIVLYLAVILAFSAFGKFLKECDEQIHEFNQEKK